ncbi:MAG: ATP-dependent helicase HrpB [Syntrophales bacterium]
MSYLNSVHPFPIDHILPELKEAVLNRPAVVLQAPPASGKTTRVPLALLEAILPAHGKIIMLEPRRIAAVAAARWMAQRLKEPVGKTVGYAIRFDRRISKDTRLEVVTEGILTRRLLDDPALDGVAMIIFDEFHERSLQADLALALSLDIQRGLRADLKLLVMSATLEAAPIAALLGNAPVISASGESFPVAERYLPGNGWAGGRGEPWEDRIVGTVLTALRETTGDILVFLPGAGEIRRAAAAIQEFLKGREDPVSLHPLYGDLPFAEQERAILPARQRKIVLATNIAETSLTIEGVRVVIDGGQARRLQYDPATGMNRLVTVTTSRASATQRQGRAGRLGPGTCYRLYSRHVYESMIPFTPPEILTSDLSSLVLELAAWGITDPLAMAWLDPPPKASWEGARQLLTDLDALDRTGTVTTVGRDMVHLPLHPRLGRLLLRAAESGRLHLGADLAALLSERDIMRRNNIDDRDRQGGADISERIAMLQRWRKEKQTPVGTDPYALRAVERAAEQLRSLAKTAAEGTVRKSEDPAISSLLLHAYPDRIAKRREEGGGHYLLAQGRGVRLPRGSALAANPFLVAVHLDGGEKAEGTIHMAEPVSEEIIRREMSAHIATRRQVEWDRQERRMLSFLAERLGALTLSVKSFPALDEEAIPILCQAIRSGAAVLSFGREDRQFQGRVALLHRAFPGDNWPDLSEEALLSSPEGWLAPWLAGIRTGDQLAGLALLPALKGLLSREQRQRLDEGAPAALVVPSGRSILLDYDTGELPILAVKLQELFGLAATPTVAGGRVAVLIHLLSPAGRPVQVTRDLKGFWESGYPQVKKELQGRYPKHPWPENPWGAVPTHRTKSRSK